MWERGHRGRRSQQGWVFPVSLQLKTVRITWSYKVTLGFFSYDWIDWGDVLYVLLFCINNIIYVAKLLQQSNRASAPLSNSTCALSMKWLHASHWQQIKGSKTGNVVPGQRADYTTNGINKQENKSHEEQSWFRVASHSTGKAASLPVSFWCVCSVMCVSRWQSSQMQMQHERHKSKWEFLCPGHTGARWGWSGTSV